MSFDYSFVLPPKGQADNSIIGTMFDDVRDYVNQIAAGSITGTVNAGTQYQLAYYATSTNAVSGLTLITASKALVSNTNGLPVASVVTTTELSYVSGVTSAIQTQLGTKAPLASPTFTGTVTIPTPFTLGAISVTTTGTELNYVAGVTSAIQPQLDAKASTALAFVTIGNTSSLSAERALTGTSNQIVVTDNGANSTVVLSTPQNLHTAATPTFATETLTATTNQLVLGTTNTITLSATAPSSSRVYTFPDAVHDANICMDYGNYTINGTWTFLQPVTFSSTDSLAVSDLQPTTSHTVAAHNVSIVAPYYTVASGTTLTIGTGGYFYIQQGGVTGASTLQLAQTIVATAAATSSTTFVDSNLTASITPVSPSSKIRISVSFTAVIANDASTTRDGFYTITRNSATTANNLSPTGALAILRFPVASVTARYHVSFTVIDSPNTTASTTYTVQHKVNTGTVTSTVGSNGNTDQVIILEEIL